MDLNEEWMEGRKKEEEEKDEGRREKEKKEERDPFIEKIYMTFK